MRVDETNYRDYYFYNNEHIGFLSVASWTLRDAEYVLCGLSTEDKGHLHYNSDYVNSLKSFKTIEEALYYFKKNNYKAIDKKHYLYIETEEDKISLSNSEINFLSSILKVLKDSKETKHYCKNIANSILKKIGE